MSGLIELTEYVPPPRAAITGDVARARGILGEYKVSLPEELWEISETYGMGNFYGFEMNVLHPCSPGFVYELLSRTDELRNVVRDYGSDVGTEWIPLLNVTEWMLFSPSAADRGDYLFASLGGECFHSVSAGLADFIRSYPTEIEPNLLGSQLTATTNFEPGDAYAEYPAPTIDEIRKLSAVVEGFPFAVEMFDRLRDCWPE